MQRSRLETCVENCSECEKIKLQKVRELHGARWTVQSREESRENVQSEGVLCMWNEKEGLLIA